MEKSLLRNRLISLCVCLVMLIAAGVLSLKETGVHAGEGSGINEQISTVDELSAVLLELTTQDQGGIPLVGASSEENEEEKEENEEPVKRRYTSGTFTEDTSVTVTDGGNTHSFERSLSIYIAPNAVYYSSDLTIYESKGIRTAFYLSGHLEMYLTKERSLEKFNRFTCFVAGTENNAKEEDNSIFFPEEMIGKWIDTTEIDSGKIFEANSMINEDNYETLRIIGNYLREFKDASFTQSGNVYSMKEEDLKEFYRRLGTYSEYDFWHDGTYGFEIDLTDPESPAIYAKGKKYNNNIYFENINNTIVEIPGDIDILSKEDVEKIVG